MIAKQNRIVQSPISVIDYLIKFAFLESIVPYQNGLVPFEWNTIDSVFDAIQHCVMIFVYMYTRFYVRNEFAKLPT